jgi:hypothetical protein
VKEKKKKKKKTLSQSTSTTHVQEQRRNWRLTRLQNGQRILAQLAHGHAAMRRRVAERARVDKRLRQIRFEQQHLWHTGVYLKQRRVGCTHSFSSLSLCLRCARFWVFFPFRGIANVSFSSLAALKKKPEIQTTTFPVHHAHAISKKREGEKFGFTLWRS